MFDDVEENILEIVGKHIGEVRERHSQNSCVPVHFN